MCYDSHHVLELYSWGLAAQVAAVTCGAPAWLGVKVAQTDSRPQREGSPRFSTQASIERRASSCAAPT